ncbi:MAG: protein kinase [Planctomycetota bacterium]
MPPSEPGSSSSFAGEFAPGEVLIGRYRVVALLGEGGMGQVYLADDLVLGQPVALKFLPRNIAETEGGLERFRSEVRLAREVSHPNVARVHDIGEVDGRHFLTMEFVDGEDLSSLVRRIGRVPREKAAEIGQQICAGLAEAHRVGVLHRDLKPANVMLDGEGRVRLTDFGLAVAADDTSSGLAGTPQYMAPELLEGARASEASEVYALGLVLYELFTGKRALRGESLAELSREHAAGGPDPASRVLADLDPTVEHVIARCLERDPADRPASIGEVARALPGGDPLEAAIRAGETPAPELVAAARRDVGPAWLPWSLALVAVALVATFAWIWPKSRFQGHTTGVEPRDVLVKNARDLLASLGHEERAVDGAAGVVLDRGAFAWANAKPQNTARFPAEGPAPVRFWYRSADSPLVSWAQFWVGRLLEDPPHVEPGMARVVTDLRGRLLELSVLPRVGEVPKDGEPDFAPVLAAAGLDDATLVDAQPQLVPDAPFDRRVAWTTTLPSAPDVELRVEAAALGGRVQWFDVHRPWDRSTARHPYASMDQTGNALTLFVLLVAVVFARRNLASGRADRSGAWRVGTAMFAVVVAGWVMVAHHVVGASSVYALFVRIASALFYGVFAAAFYLAVEPSFRRHFPRRLVSWVRLLQGRFADPLVGRDVLAGVASGMGLATAFAAFSYVMHANGAPGFGWAPSSGAISEFGLGRPGAEIPTLLRDAAVTTMTVVLILVLARVALRRTWPAVLAASVVTTVLMSVGFPALTPAYVAVTLLLSTLWILLLVRVGFLSVAVAGVVYLTAQSRLASMDPSHPLSEPMWLGLAMIAALLVWGLVGAVRSPVTGSAPSPQHVDRAPATRRTRA